MTWRFLLAVVGVALWPLLACAEHANIDLRVIRIDPTTGQSSEETSASSDQEPPRGGVNPRPLCQVKVNEPLALQFILVNVYPHGERKNVTVRYYVVREKKARQKEVPDLRDGLVVQGQFKMNFKPKCKVGARVRFTIPQAGIYLLRVETLNTQSDHEHFSAIDIRAK